MTREEALDRLAKFGANVMRQSRDNFGGFDGGDLQDMMEEMGLLVRVPVTEGNVETVHEFCEDPDIGGDCLHDDPTASAVVDELDKADADRRALKGER